MKRFQTLVTCLLFAFSFNAPQACGPSFITPIFVFTSRPENADAFARGNIGIIQPQYYRSVLFVAYRELNKLPFSELEQKALVTDWNAEYDLADSHEPTKKLAITHWLAQRKRVLANEPEPKIDTERSFDNSYENFLNCPAPAFENASKTLAARIAENSPTDTNIIDWTKAQDLVFANCSAVKTMPEEASQDAPTWLKDDRAYQIAAAYFYATHYDEAEKRFTSIAQNKASPWHELASYLLARITLRKASAVSSDNALSANDQQVRILSFYQQATTQLNAILADPDLKPFHSSSQQLLNLISFRTHPENLHALLAKKLLEGSENNHFLQNLTDYRLLLDKVAEDGNIDVDGKLLATFRAQSDLTDWIFTVQSDKNDAFAHAIEKWQSSKNEAWLLASLMKAKKDAPELTDLITASKAVARTSSAFLGVAYHVIRLQMAQGLTDEPRRMLDSILDDKNLQLSVSTKNQFFSERLLVAQNLDEFVQFSQRHAAAFAYDALNNQLVNLAEIPKEDEDYSKLERPWLNRSMFDTDATQIMNARMPLSMLEKIAQHSSLPDYLKPRLLVSAWTRAVLLTDDKTALNLTPDLLDCTPELKPYLPNFSKAKNDKSRLFEATWTMLNNPAMRPVVDSGIGRETGFSDIDDYRDNWWCSLYQPANSDTESLTPVFLNEEDLNNATAENNNIDKKAASGSNFLAAQTTAWAKLNPNDKRLPHALFLVVRATRFGCQNCETEKISKAAFDLLKTQYGKTPWKKKTPYWFKDENCPAK